MSVFFDTKTLPYAANQMHSLILDIEKYPEFLPWCKQAKIIEIISPDNLKADLLVNFKNFFEKYRSDVRYGKDNKGVYFIETRAIEGPFKKLFSSWKIEDLKQEKMCKIDFFIEFQFNSFLLEKMMGVIFEKAAAKMVQSFEDRARQLILKSD